MNIHRAVGTAAEHSYIADTMEFNLYFEGSPGGGGGGVRRCL